MNRSSPNTLTNSSISRTSRLDPPDSPPPVLNPGWERYWGQFVTSAEQCHEVDQW
jgi:hypothetical protein